MKLVFDANTVEPGGVFEHIPFTGWLRGMITASAMIATKKGDGEMLTLELEVTDGEYKGRKVWDRLNIDNPSEKAKEIALRTLSAICHSIGVLNVKDSEELHHKEFEFKLTVQIQEGYEPKNEIKGYRPIEGTLKAWSKGATKPVTSSTAPTEAIAPPPARKTNGGTKPPWEK